MQRPRLHRLLDRGVIALLLLGFFYNAYRYPFQINAAGTSPTYEDTPALLSFGKYVAVAIVLAYLVLLILGSRVPTRIGHPLRAVGYLFLALMPMVSGLATGEADLITTGFFFLVPLVLHGFAGWSLSFAALNRTLAATVWIAIGVEALQLLLFATVGRLPALGYPNSFSVRFGSFLDDPNGFGLLLSWLIPFSVVHFRGRRRALAVGALLLSLLLTQSLTALAAFLGAAGVLTVMLVRERPRLALPVLSVVLAATMGVGAAAFVFRQELLLAFEIYMATKAGSIAAHKDALTVFTDLRLPNLLGIEPAVEWWQESGYANLLAYFGLVYVIVYLTVGALALVFYYRTWRSPAAPASARHFAFGAMGLLIGVYLGNLNLPVVSIYPLDLLTALALGLASAGLVSASDQAAEPEPPGTGVAAATQEARL